MIAADCASIFSGTDGPDTLEGDRCDNNISGLRGNDVIYGYRSADELYGNRGSDRLYDGDDKVYSGGLDGKRDLVSCGWGRDFVFIAENDRGARDCEVVVVATE